MGDSCHYFGARGFRFSGFFVRPGLSGAAHGRAGEKEASSLKTESPLSHLSAFVCFSPPRSALLRSQMKNVKGKTEGARSEHHARGDSPIVRSLQTAREREPRSNNNRTPRSTASSFLTEKKESLVFPLRQVTAER